MSEQEERSVEVEEEHSETGTQATEPQTAPQAPPSPQEKPRPYGDAPTADPDFDIDDTQEQQSEYIKKVVRDFYDQVRGHQGRPPLVKMTVERVRPEEAACKLPSIEIPRNQEPDPLVIAREHWGGDYFVRLRGGGKYLGEGMILRFAGPPRPPNSYNPWATPQQQQGGFPGYPPGYPPPGYPPFQPVAPPQPRNDEATAEIGRSLVAFGEQVKEAISGFRETVETMRAEVGQMRDGKVDIKEEVSRSVDLVTGLITLGDKLRPPQPELEPAEPSDGSSFLDSLTRALHAFNKTVENAPVIAGAWGAMKGDQGMSGPAPVASAPRPAPSTPPPRAAADPPRPAARAPRRSTQASTSVPPGMQQTVGKPAAKKAPSKKTGAKKGKRKT